MKKSFLPAGYNLRKISEVDLLIADYISNSDDEIAETDTVWLHEEIGQYCDAPEDDKSAECYFIVDANGNAIGLARIYSPVEEDEFVPFAME